MVLSIPYKRLKVKFTRMEGKFGKTHLNEVKTTVNQEPVLKKETRS